MPTKEAMSQEINEMLGTNIEWDRLLEDDLEHFYELVETGALIEPLGKQFAKEQGKEKLEEEIDDWRPGKILQRVL